MEGDLAVPGMRNHLCALAPVALGVATALALSACAVSQPTAAAGRPSSPASATSPDRPTAPSPAMPRPATPGPSTSPAPSTAPGKVPATATAVTISMEIGLNQGGRKPPAPVTITDPAKVRALIALINGLGRFPPGQYSCPADFADGLTLTFLAGPGARAIAVATVDLSGCDVVGLTIGGRRQPDLAGPGTDSGPRILRAAGLPWRIPTE
jgi:hypothetical protein